MLSLLASSSCWSCGSLTRVRQDHWWARETWDAGLLALSRAWHALGSSKGQHIYSFIYKSIHISNLKYEFTHLKRIIFFGCI